MNLAGKKNSTASSTSFVKPLKSSPIHSDVSGGDVFYPRAYVTVCRSRSDILTLLVLKFLFQYLIHFIPSLHIRSNYVYPTARDLYSFFLHSFCFTSFLFAFRPYLYVPRRSPKVPDIRYTGRFRRICHTSV